jgi:type III restriction enzyme
MSYVLLGEDVVREWQEKGARVSELLDFARLRPVVDASMQTSLL